MAKCALILKIFLAMLAFAANSILCRLALKGGHIDPFSFSSLRLASGACVLLPFLFYHAKAPLSLWRPLSGFYLMVYAVLFSVAYIHLDTGVGALLLFGAVQFAMVIHGLFKGESLSAIRACGLVLALAGIAALLLPGAKAPPLYSTFLMIAAGLAWAAYSIRGKAAQAAGASTAANFVLATPMALALSVLFMKHGHYDAAGIGLSLLSGAVASAGAYVLWYTLLPSLGSITASTLQLSVPCLAMLGGVVFLGESLTARTIFSALAVLAGIVMVTREKACISRPMAKVRRHK
ncbi:MULTISPECIES: DMT family transporter [Pectobacterium]|uniref:Transporter n=4 Tax=Pectobacterium TaxID=122277 RepID=A0AAI9PD73_PECCC|nr:MULTISPECIES: DMT family transporter [Pectobacterium]KHT16850.1 membrane protein [Pectobacterium carotovorum subsp. carotovorum]MBE5221392.1 DMT family transporter [Pectobacterium quasiaquaticum]MCA6976039.1 DMT family transporter [Pectobacterium carotovorum]MCQ8232090.1 DMT family transporter [Pectobacterium carotovorum]MDK9421942.1 DMT family transporter [Pectobacterium carotovorum]